MDELVTILGINLAADALPNVTKFNSKLDTAVKYCEKVAGAALVTGAAIVAFVEKMASSAAGIAVFNHYTGISTDSIQQWSYAVEQAGGSAAGLKADMVSLEKALNPLMPGRYNEGMMMMFGPDAMRRFKSTDEALMAIAGRMQGMSKQRQLQWGDALNLSPDTMLLLQRGPAAIKKSMEEMRKSMLTPEQTERAFRFMQVWNKLKLEMYKTGENIVTLLLPGIQKALKAFDGWLGANQRWISSGIDRFVKGVADGFDRFGAGLGELRKHMPVVNKLFDIMLDPKVIGGTVLVALTGIATVLGVIAAKYALIGAAVLTVVAGIEDLSSSVEKDENGIIGPSGKDTMINRAADWVHDHIPEFMRTPENEWKRAGSRPGKSLAMEAIPKFKELWDAATGKNVPVDNNYAINRAFLEKQGRQGDVTNNQTNNISINNNGAPQEGFGEARGYINDLRRDFAGATVSGQ